MHRLCDFIDDELMELERKVEQNRQLSGGEVEYGDKLAHFKKCLLTVKAMEDNYSEARTGNGRRTGGSYGYRDSYDSYRRDRDSMGRYSRDGFMDKLMEMRDSAPNEKTRHAVDRMISELEN